MRSLTRKRKRYWTGYNLKMSKNLIIVVLVIVIAILIGAIFLTNYEWFSQEWLIGLAVVLGSITGAGILAYIKIRKII